MIQAHITTVQTAFSLAGEQAVTAERKNKKICGNLRHLRILGLNLQTAQD